MKITKELAEAIKPVIVVVIIFVVFGGMFLLFSIVGLFPTL